MRTVIDAKVLRPGLGAEWLLVVAGLLILYVPTFYDLTKTHWRNADFAHGPIILGIIVWLIWDKRQVLLAAPTNTAPLPGFVVLIFGLLLYVLGRSQGIITEVAALCPVLAGVLLILRGWPAIRHMWLMLLFIAYLVPLPGFFVDAMTLPLKQVISTIVGNILYSTGYPIAQDGVMLNIGQYQLLVADACSGLNSMFSLSAIGLLYLYLMRYTSWLHNALILASLVPIAFVANVVRVVVLVLVTYYLGDGAGQGFLHGASGLVLFVIALLMILALDAILVTSTKLLRRAQ